MAIYKHISVRFYWQHDLDLLPLCFSKDFEMGLWLKAAVRAYARNESLLIPVPPKPDFPIEVDNYNARFTLNSVEDADVIDALSQFRKGFCNSAIKTIFRFYLDRPNLDPFLDYKSYLVKTRVKGEGSVIVPVTKTKPDGRTIMKNKTADAEDGAETAVKNDTAKKIAVAEIKTEPAPAQTEKVTVVVSQAENTVKKTEPVTVNETDGKKTAPQGGFTGNVGIASVSEPKKKAEDGDFDLFSAIDNLF